MWQGFTISIHAPHARSDKQSSRAHPANPKFQSTLLMRGATIDVAVDDTLDRISIHAPHARSDFRAPASGATYLFQSTLLMRGATLTAPDDDTVAQFQSTLLMRGATDVPQKAERCCPISIHAPHARSDCHGDIESQDLAISIHAPHARSDSSPTSVVKVWSISIHAPHARSDRIYRAST